MTQHDKKTGGSRVSICEEKRRLSEEFVAASHAVNELQTQQVQAVIEGDSDFARFDDLLHMARENKKPGQVCADRSPGTTNNIAVKSRLSIKKDCYAGS